MKRATLHIAVYVLTITIMAICLPVPPCARSAGGKPLMWGFALDGYPVTEGRLKQVESATGLKSDLLVFFLQWPSPEDASSSQFPLESLEAIWKTGAIPCLTWEPMYYKDGKEIMVPYTRLLAGDYDRYIIRFAEQARSWKKPFLIRFAHEMNIKRYHWGTTEDEYGPKSPEIYRQMHRYVFDLFGRAGAYNALWVFCPNAESVPNTSHDPSASWNVISSYYPGDLYTDVLGIDGYNWGTTQTMTKHGWDSRWKSFEEIFEPAYGQLSAIGAAGGQKPLIVFETATVSQGGDKKQWIREALDVSEQWGLQGIVWFQSRKELDWRINSDPDADHAPLIKSRVSFPHSWIKELAERKAR
ncbi:MAG TPA: glycosyl hydrolase [Syntrophorhabdaceae bacterium]|nr:glycosyl hydrolase [Syntrophorhabdaceae bacterium]